MTHATVCWKPVSSPEVSKADCVQKVAEWHCSFSSKVGTLLFDTRTTESLSPCTAVRQWWRQYTFLQSDDKSHL